LPTDHQLVPRVTAVIQHVVDTLVMPSFRTLRPEDIHAKDTPGDPDDLVTIVDKAAERALVERLSGLVPGAVFVGEEAVSEDPDLLLALSSESPAWLIDPVDGTKNFARGHADFGVMLALVERGVTRASWIAVPAAHPSGFLVVAERDSGTYIDGVPVRTAYESTALPRGTVHTRMMPGDGAREVERRLKGRYEPRLSTGAAATEYSAILRGEKEFVIYYRLHPWDHAPGALAIVEAGGAAVHVSGKAYTALSPNEVTVLAASPELAETVRSWLT
jgi:fructose-1,6-bisphosphatase/inositol monophosphatase family enzyme